MAAIGQRNTAVRPAKHPAHAVLVGALVLWLPALGQILDLLV